VPGSADGNLFDGGVGKHAAAVRAAILDGMARAGIRLDAAIEAREIPVDEARVLAQEALVALAA